MNEQVHMRAGVAAHLAYCGVLGDLFVEACVQVERDMRDGAMKLSRDVVGIYAEGGPSARVKAERCAACLDDYMAFFTAVKAHLCAVKAQYVAMLETQNANFQEEHGDAGGVEAARLKQETWLRTMIELHKRRVNVYKKQRDIIEANVRLLADEMLKALPPPPACNDDEPSE